MIKLSGCTLGYEHAPLLMIDHLTFACGAVTAILGGNGKGKTTLLRAMAGLLPYGGSIRVDDREISSLPHCARAHRIAYLPQTLKTPEMDVYTLVSHGRFSRLGYFKTLGDSDRAAIRAAMEQTGVWGLRDRLCKTLSGGQKQCAYLAMAIAQDTPYLLLDEPDTFLDTAHQRHVREILRSLAAGGKGVVCVSHDIAAAFSCSDKLCLLADGGVLCGTPQELLGTDALVKALGVGVMQANDTRLLYPFVLTKEDCHGGVSSAEPQ